MNVRLTLTTAFQHVARIPMTLTIGVAAIGIACLPPAAARLLQFDRAEIAAGEIWRLTSGHLTHWNAEHVLWDLLMFVVLGAACEIRNQRRMWLCTVSAAACVSTLVFYLFPGVEAYRGLSGIDTALFTLLAIDLMRDTWRQRRGKLAVAIGGLLVGFIAKTAYEAVTGQAFFVDQNSAGFNVLVWDHIAAAVVGAVIAFGRYRPRQLTSPRIGLRPAYLEQRLAQH
jgi:rhomboid family GlyGly-CTERM serine protease